MEKRVELGGGGYGKAGNTVWGTKIRESRKHGISAFTCHLSVSTFVISPRLGLDRLGSKNRIHPGISLVDPGDAALLRLCRRHPLPPLSPYAAVAATAIGRYRHRLRPLGTPFTATAAVDRRRRWRPLLPSLSPVPAAASHFRRPPPLPPPASATTNKNI